MSSRSRNADRSFIRVKSIAGKEGVVHAHHRRSAAYMMATKLSFLHTAHVREIAFKGAVHNNKMERMNGEIRDHEKTRRWLKDTPILEGLQIYHNFVRQRKT